MNIEIHGLDHAIQTIDRRFSDAALKTKCLELAKRLCEESGRPILESGFQSHATITTEPTEDGCKIVIDGEDVLFIEFGTGDAAGELSGQYDDVPSVVRPGSWSETHDKQYSRFGFWFWYAGQVEPTYETRPHSYTYFAYEAMVKELPRVAEEVFTK